MSKASVQFIPENEEVASTLSQQRVRKQQIRPLKFTQWLEKQVKRKDAVGELARWAESDRCWPRLSNDYIHLRNHLRIEHVETPIVCIMAFDTGWEEYAMAKRTMMEARRTKKIANATANGTGRSRYPKVIQKRYPKNPELIKENQIAPLI